MTNRIACLLLLLPAPLLRAAELPGRPGGTRVSLDGQRRSLAQAAAELARQANVAIDTARADSQRIVTLRLDNVPFWQALEQLARAADHKLSISSQGARVALLRGPYRPVQTSVNGLFRFEARRAISRLEFDDGVPQTEVYVDVNWEPSFKAYYLELDGAALAAFDLQNRPLVVVREGSSRVPVASATPELVIKLRGVPRDQPRIGRLAGAVNFIGTSQMLQFAFPLADAAPSLKRAEVTGTLSSLRKNVRLWTAVVELAYPDDMPKFESFQSFLLDNEAWLLRADGTKFPVRKFELGVERNGKFPITYYFHENDKDIPALGDLKDWKLVVRVPGRIVEEKVPFRLQDVPLP